MQFPMMSCHNCHSTLGPFESVQRRIHSNIQPIRCGECLHPVTNLVNEDDYEDDLKDISKLIRNWDIQDVDQLIDRAFSLKQWTTQNIFEYLCYSFNYILERGVDRVLAINKEHQYKKWISRGQVEYVSHEIKVYTRNPITSLRRFMTARKQLAYHLYEWMSKKQSQRLEYAFLFGFLHAFVQEIKMRYLPFPWWSFLPQEYSTFCEECILCFENKHTFISVCSNHHRCCIDCLTKHQKSLSAGYTCFYCREQICSY